MVSIEVETGQCGNSCVIWYTRCSSHKLVNIRDTVTHIYKTLH